MSSDTSGCETLRASNPQSTPSSASESPTTSHTSRLLMTAIPFPSVSRMRNPVPPSPLSRIQSAQESPSESSLHPVGSSNSFLNHQEGQNSACFIHSHLDRHGSLQDWLNSNSSSSHHPRGSSHPTQSNHVSKAIRHAAHPTHRHHPHLPPHAHHRPSPASQIQSPAQTPSSSRVTSPTNKDSSASGYDSDRSSTNGVGSAILDGDFMDEEEKAGSLTKQLAETAQGVREMSKQLGRTRVRSRIQHILIVTKARDNRLIQLTRELALYVMQKRPTLSLDGTNRPLLDYKNEDRGMVVYVDAQLRTSKRFDAEGLQRDYPHLFQPVIRRRSSSTTSVTSLSSPAYSNGRPKDEGQLRYWTGEMCSNFPHLFDFVVTLGGDGTVLFTSWLFQRIVPPVLPFALGSLGFLTNFDFANYKETMDKVVDDGIRVNLRMRFTCTVYRAIAPEEASVTVGKGGRKRQAIKRPGGEILMSQVDKGGWEALEGPSGAAQNSCVEGKDKEIMCFSTRPVEQFEVLNDLVVDRGPSPYVSLLELFGDENHLTTAQADGLCVATPTGSTAYSLSAGGSLVHPQIPAILISPICPHTLSFRPILLPDSMELRICVPYNSRSTAWASFDGRGRVELKQGDHIKVAASKYPFPTVCADKASTDWFSSVSRTLRWNEREKQKSFVVVEEDREPTESGPKHRHRETIEEVNAKLPSHASKEPYQDDGEDEEEEGFDIDDKSGGEGTGISLNTSDEIENLVPRRLHALANPQKSGVDSPDRFVTPYEGPSPLSQRHLVEALTEADIQEKENERGERDEIRSGGNASRINGPSHRIHRGRSISNAPDGSRSLSEERTSPKADGTRRSRSSVSPKAQRQECKAKAFAFHGQDDSASDQSDDQSA